MLYLFRQLFYSCSLFGISFSFFGFCFFAFELWQPLHWLCYGIFVQSRFACGIKANQSIAVDGFKRVFERERKPAWNFRDDEFACDHILASIEIEHWKNVRSWIASTFYWESLSLADISSCSLTNPIAGSPYTTYCVHGIPFNWIGFRILWQRIVTSPVIVSCRTLNYMCNVQTRPFTCSDVCHCMVHDASQIMEENKF